MTSNGAASSCSTSKRAATHLTSQKSHLCGACGLCQGLSCPLAALFTPARRPVKPRVTGPGGAMSPDRRRTDAVSSTASLGQPGSTDRGVVAPITAACPRRTAGYVLRARRRGQRSDLRLMRRGVERCWLSPHEGRDSRYNRAAGEPLAAGDRRLGLVRPNGWRGDGRRHFVRSRRTGVSARCPGRCDAPAGHLQILFDNVARRAPGRVDRRQHGPRA